MHSDDIQKAIEQHMLEQNNKGLEEFDGLSPHHLHFLLYDTFSESSILTLQKLTEKQYSTIPILNQVKYLANCILKEQEVKLTKTGALPTKIVFDVYNNGGFKEEYIENGIVKLRKETDSFSIQLSNILLQLSGIIKKRNNKLSITQKGVKIINDNTLVLPLLFKTFCTKFNWSYFDGYEDEKWGQLGFGFSLVLLSKYGNLKRKDSFYAEKYYNAFPDLLDFHPYNDRIKQSAFGAYNFRTFNHFLTSFGFIKYDKRVIFEPREVIKTKLFDAFIKVKM
ncbi:hypothetical protein [Pontimicrobium sp. MEBiC01747]